MMTPAAVLALVPTATLTFLLLAVTYGLTSEYGDTGAGAATTAVHALSGGVVGIVLVAACAAVTFVAFELTGDSDGWWVWVGPATLRERPLREGQVGPRS